LEERRLTPESTNRRRTRRRTRDNYDYDDNGRGEETFATYHERKERTFDPTENEFDERSTRKRRRRRRRTPNRYQPFVTRILIRYSTTD
jgi:hypothetical protein